MRILITGATGFIGSHLIAAIYQKLPAIEILAPCRKPDAAKSLFSPFGNVSLIATDDWAAIERYNPEVTIHLASFITSKNDATLIDNLIESNITYGVKLLDALKKCSSHRLFVNTGSFAEYRLGPRSFDNAYLYSATKTAFRSFLAYYAGLSGFKYITAVPYSVYGGKSKVKRIFDFMLDSVDASSPVGMTSGMQILDFIHVDDICSFYITLLSNLDKFITLEQGREFFLGTGRGHNLREVAKIMESVSGKRLNIAWGQIPHRERDTMYAVAPISANANLWHSNIPLEQGIIKFLYDE